MAVIASDSEINQAPYKNKFRIFKMITKSLQRLTNGVAGKERGGDGRCSLTATVIPVRTVKRFKSSSKSARNENRIRRGQIKIKMFKLIAKSIKDLAVSVAGGKNKAAGNRRCNYGCFSSPATVVPVVTMVEFKSTFEGEIKIWKKIDEAAIQVSEST